MRATPIVAVVGTSGAGKTTFLEKLIRALKKRNITVGTIKHHRHDFDMDKPGKDTWRHAQAGADAVVISSPAKIAVIKKVKQEVSLEQILEFIPEMDIILAEGYKYSDMPKIEVNRQAHSPELICRQEELIALVTDVTRNVGAPVFGLADADGVADFLINKYGLQGSGTSSNQFQNDIENTR